MRTTRADWAASVPYSGITNKPASPFIPTDISQIGAGGFGRGNVPVWNSSLGRFIKGTIRDIAGFTAPADAPGSSAIASLDTPGIATRRQPPGLAFGPTQDVWLKQFFDLRQYGAQGDASSNDAPAFNRLVSDLNSEGGGRVRIQAGDYLFDDAISAITVPCFIEGDGPSLSQLTFAGPGIIFNTGGLFCGARNLGILTNGSSGPEYAIEVSDGTGAGDALFLFENLDISSVGPGILISAVGRGGFMDAIRISAAGDCLVLTGQGCGLSRMVILNSGDVSARGMVLNGDRHQLRSLRIVGSAASFDKGILVESGDTGSICDSLIFECGAEAVFLTDGSGESENWRIHDIQFGNIGANPAFAFNPSLHYVNALQGLGGNTDTRFDARRELYGVFTWNPASVLPLQSVTEDFTISGAQPGDQVAVGTPYPLSFMQVCGAVISASTVRLTVTNMSASTVDLGSGAWKIRTFN